jgi:hypothetical protein
VGTTAADIIINILKPLRYQFASKHLPAQTNLLREGSGLSERKDRVEKRPSKLLGIEKLPHQPKQFARTAKLFNILTIDGQQYNSIGVLAKTRVYT